MNDAPRPHSLDDGLGTHRCRSTARRAIAGLKLTLVLAASVFLAPSRAADDLQILSIWARVLFGTDGKIETFEFVSPRAHPRVFLERVRGAVANARIPAQARDGTPVTFKTGMQIDLVIDRSPANPGFRVATVRMSPILLVEAFPVPDHRDLERMKAWSANFLRVSCTVQVSGRCKDILVEGQDLPEAARQFGKESAEAWRFEPQELGEQPVESPFSLRLNLRSVVMY